MGPGPNDAPKDASVAAKLGAEFAATPILLLVSQVCLLEERKEPYEMNKIKTLIHTAKFASQPNR